MDSKLINIAWEFINFDRYRVLLLDLQQHPVNDVSKQSYMCSKNPVSGLPDRNRTMSTVQNICYIPKQQIQI